MGKLDRVIMGVIALCAACSDAAPQQAATGPSEAPPRAKSALAEPAPDPRFDADGKLKPSELRMSWLEIPVSFVKQPGSTEREAIFEADGLTVTQLSDYVLSRAMPDRIEKRRNGEVFSRARPVHTRLPLAPVNVTVLEIDAARDRIRLVIEDLTPTEPPFQNQAEANAALRKMVERAK
jgi:hypothetical protein